MTTAKRNGFTVMELAVGMAIAGVVAIASAALFRAGIQTFNYTARQNAALQTVNKAFDGQGSVAGMVRGARAAASVNSLSASSLVLISSNSTTTFTFSGSTLVQSSSATYTLSTDISSMTVKYYNLDGAGHIAVSTQAGSASLITIYLKVAGLKGTQKTYSFYTGAQLRNHQ